jgi:hypothetical protein
MVYSECHGSKPHRPGNSNFVYQDVEGRSKKNEVFKHHRFEQKKGQTSKVVKGISGVHLPGVMDRNRKDILEQAHQENGKD